MFQMSQKLKYALDSNSFAFAFETSRTSCHMIVSRRREAGEEGNQLVEWPSREAMGSQRQARGEGGDLEGSPIWRENY